MKKETFTTEIIRFLQIRRIQYITVWLTAFVFFGNQSLHAQCPLACDDLVQVSVDRSCEAEITPEMLLEEVIDPMCGYTVVVFNTNGLPLPTPVVNRNHIGKTLTVAVYSGSNSCWGSIYVEDKFPPIIVECPNDTVSCNAAAYILPDPVVVDNCTINPLLLKKKIVSDVILKYHCDSFYAGKRILSYYFVDESGNKSDTCDQMVLFTRIDSANIDWPLDAIFNCYDLDTIPSPLQTGIPTYLGYRLDDINQICKIGVTHSDQIIDVCPGNYKILRTWTVVDWCRPAGRNVYPHIQLIKIVDTTGPQIDCPVPLTISTVPQSCTGTVILQAPHLRPGKECSDTTVKVGYRFGGLKGSGTYDGSYTQNVRYLKGGLYSISGLPVGYNWVVFRVTDECGNYTDCETQVYVEDKVPPIAVCDQKTIVSLGVDGIARVDAFTFDDGSHDNCGISHYEAKRMDDGRPCQDSIYGPYWNPFVYFCCADVGKTLMVSMRVWDYNGNSNTCMVEVEVQDKIPPTIVRLPNITVQCDFDYADLSVFGSIRRDITERKPIVINHPGTKFDGPAIDGYAYDGCGVTVKDTAFYFLHCNVGHILRRFTATDNGGLSTIYDQYITFDTLRRYNVIVTIPPRYESTTICMDAIDVDPSITGKPRIDSAGKCSNIAYTYEDLKFSFDPDACLKILRKWTIIDWCVYNKDSQSPNPRGYWTGIQEIKIINKIPPTITSDCRDRSIPVFGRCGGEISLIGTAKDDCTDSVDLIWKHEIDLFNDGKKDTAYTHSGSHTNYFYPHGTHRVTFYVTDGCSNESKCSFYITVYDGKKPTPYCISSITTTVMPSSKSVAIWAKDFNLNSEDNCTPKDSLKYYFLNPINQRFEPSMLFDCSHIGLNTVRIYVVDQAGNSDYCEVQIDIQDPTGVCPTGITVQGRITNQDNDPMQGVTAIWERVTPQGYNQTYTNGDGIYTFNNITAGMNYSIRGEKSGAAELNGITTQDIVLIQRHILSQTIFNKPYQYVAADVNESCTITAADMSDIRKLILGKIQQFSSSPSWKFVPKTSMLPGSIPTCPVSESIVYNSISRNQLTSDFYGVKMGDISGNADADQSRKVTSRNSGMDILVQDQNFSSGNDLHVSFLVNSDFVMSGCQLVIDIDQRALEFISASSPNGRDIQDQIEFIDGKLYVLAAAKENIALAKSGELFSVTFKAKSNGKISEVIHFTDERLSAELYDDKIEVFDARLKFRETNSKSLAYRMYQNRPNPFQEKTVIGFEIPKDQQVEFIISDMNGKIILKDQAFYSSGYNEFTIQKDQLGAEGVLYVQIYAPEYTETKRMILIQ